MFRYAETSKHIKYSHREVNREKNPFIFYTRATFYFEFFENYFRFESDFSNSGGGFHLEYEVQGCGGTLNKPEGRFTSPNYPISYPHDTHCQWVIEVDYGHLIEITFQDFDFESSSGCYQDGLVVSFFSHLLVYQFHSKVFFLQVSNDQNATKILSRFCGSMHNASHPGVVTSNSNKVYIHFYSDLSYSGRGFSATYKSIPTSELTQ